MSFFIFLSQILSGQTISNSGSAAIAVTEQHKMLARSNGTWTGEVSFWITPDKPPLTSTSLLTNYMDSNGLFQISEVKGNITGVGTPFTGLRITGYDAGRKVFTRAMLADGSPGGAMEGKWNEATKSISMLFKKTDAFGKEKDLKEVYTFVNKDEEILEIYDMHPAGNAKEFKILKVIWRRIIPVSAKQDTSVSRSETMKQQIELSKPNKNHYVLAGLNGKWTFKGRHIPADSTQKPIQTFGTITRKGIWENRYFITETTSGKKIKMEWADGKEKYYHDMYTEGYDNAKQKFFFTSIANHWSTGYMSCEGSYDSTAKTLTYEGELEPAPGITVKVARIIKLVDKDHYKEVWYRSIGGREIQRTETSYTRIKSSN